MPSQIEERFWGYVSYMHPTDCWEWRASHIQSGYAEFWDGARVRRAHRWAYEYFIGPIPGGLVLDHLCRNKGCVNPRHVEPVTQRENIRRGTAPAALNARRTHCIHGHALVGENVYIKPNGARQCVPCRRVTDNNRGGR